VPSVNCPERFDRRREWIRVWGPLAPFLHANPLYGPADPADPTYRHFERVVNPRVHGGVFAAFTAASGFLQGCAIPSSTLGLAERWPGRCSLMPSSSFVFANYMRSRHEWLHPEGKGSQLQP